MYEQIAQRKMNINNRQMPAVMLNLSCKSQNANFYVYI